MRICVATGTYYKSSETMINYHIANLFGGELAVLSSFLGQPDPFGRAHFSWAQHRPSAKPDRQPLIHSVRSLILHRTARVPFGAARQRLQTFLRDQKVEAVLVEFGTEALRVTPPIAEMGLPVFSYFRGADASQHLRDPLRPEAYRRMMPQLRGIFSVSQFLLDNLARHGIRHDNSFVVPSGVDTSLFVPGEKRAGLFVAVGRFIEKKRPDITVEAFCKAARTNPAARLEMIGGGPMLDRCRAIADGHGMADRVIFHGHTSHDFVRQRLMEAAVFLQHSLTGRDGNTEGLPIAVQEAMACGCAVISTRHAGIPEAVAEGETGFLVAEGDAAAFADQIAYSLVEAQTIARMGARGREVACARFDNRVLIKQVEATMLRLVRQPAQARNQSDTENP